ncbi:MAG TPA: BamA/TamA family outer membrane protein [Mucilaginibacter sp.]
MKQTLLIIFAAFCCTCAFCQTRTDSIPAQKTKEKNIEFTVMPFLGYNRNLQVMLGAIPMMMYKLNVRDTVSPQSLSGLSAIYTTNGSYFVAIFNRWYVKEDKWRFKLFALTGNYTSQFFVDDVDEPDFFEYGTKTSIISIGGQHKIIRGFYGGISYTYAHYNTVYENNIAPTSITYTNGLALDLLKDTRDAVYYPTQGDKFKLSWTTYPEWFGNAVVVNRIALELNKYFPERNNNDVIAVRLFGKFGLGNIPFEQQVTLGGRDIRGYSEGKYRGDGLMDIQGEYRYNFGKNMGLVGFAGLATLYGSDTQSFNWKLYPGAGGGFRYNPFKKTKFNVGVDGAVGKGDYGIYFRIGEAF